MYQVEGAYCSAVLTVHAEGNVDDSLLCDALQIWDLGTFEVCGCRGVSYVDPADSLLGIEEVHGRGLFGAGGQQAVEIAQVDGLDVLGVGDQQDGQAVHWHWNVTWTRVTVSRRTKPIVLEPEHPHDPPWGGVVRESLPLLFCHIPLRWFSTNQTCFSCHSSHRPPNTGRAVHMERSTAQWKQPSWSSTLRHQYNSIQFNFIEYNSQKTPGQLVLELVRQFSPQGPRRGGVMGEGFKLGLHTYIWMAPENQTSNCGWFCTFPHFSSFNVSFTFLKHTRGALIIAPVPVLPSGTHRSWPCMSGCLAGTGSPPHRSRCSRLQCWYRTDCRFHTHCTHQNLSHRENRSSQSSGKGNNQLGFWKWSERKTN